MSTSLLYHGFGLIGYRYVRQEFPAGQVLFRIEHSGLLRLPDFHRPTGGHQHQDPSAEASSLWLS